MKGAESIDLCAITQNKVLDTTMDIWSKIFWQAGAVLSVILLIVALVALSNAEGGRLTVESLEHLSGTLTALYQTLIIVIYPWMALGIFILIRFLIRLKNGG